ncbi:MAG: hypothetical protein RJQ21_07775 [Rhodospirillales bacterium]
MSKNFARSFASLGTKLQNPRSDWSAVSPDGNKVAISIWRDELDYTDRSRPVFDCRKHKDIATWSTYRGNQKRKEHLRHALENCDGRFGVVLLTAVDTDVLPREIREASPWQMVGVITHFDPDSGGFRAEFLKP